MSQHNQHTPHHEREKLFLAKVLSYEPYLEPRNRGSMEPTQRMKAARFWSRLRIKRTDWQQAILDQQGIKL